MFNQPASHQSLFLTLLCFHITFGGIALCSALGAMSFVKGSDRHKQCGRCFFYCMTGILFTAIPLAILIHNLFLFLIAIFSYYLAFTGYRYAKNRSGKPTKLDYIVNTIMIISSVIMFSLGIGQYNIHHYQAVVLLVFGIAGLMFSITDLKMMKAQVVTGKLRIAQHLSAMLGATIATITAFCVTNIHINYPLVLWLGPTFVLIPVILWWKNKILTTA